MADFPDIALSVRQPWAWAIVTGLKDIENRSSFAVTKGGFEPRRVAIHAAKGTTRAEYENARAFMAALGVACPRPDELPRGAIVGAATVRAIVKTHESPWFFGPRGLVLADQVEVAAIPAVGALGYFKWAPNGGELDAPRPWMAAWPNDPRARRGALKRTPPAPLLDWGP